MIRGSSGQSCVKIGMGEYHIGREPMVSIGLGSCVALVIHDRERSMGGMAHVVLPSCNGTRERPGKYADLAVDLLVSSLINGRRGNGSLVAKIAGGACMFSNLSNHMNIGERNVECVKAHLKRHGIRLEAEDTGGNCGRTIYYFPEEQGKVIVKLANGSVVTL